MIESAIAFVVECEKLKSVLRRTYPVNTERRENSAEHSWTLALLAMTLVPKLDPSLDLLRVLRMLILHDIVEIDAGDTFCYTVRPDKQEQERLAAERIFGLLPNETAREFLDLWLEFEASATREAAVANALDRLVPLVQNFRNEGRSWKEHGITYEQVFTRNQTIRHGSEDLWSYVQTLLDEAVAKGYLPRVVEGG